MLVKNNLREVISGVLLLLVSSACGSITPHENFLMIMRSDIGKNADEPSSYTKVYRQYRLSVRALSNGNLEEEYKRGKNCRHFFEINPKTNLIVGWRYEGSEQYCRIVP